MYVICAGKDNCIIGIYNNLQLCIEDWKKIKEYWSIGHGCMCAITNPHYFYIRHMEINTYMTDVH